MKNRIILPERLQYAAYEAAFDGENEAGAWLLLSRVETSRGYNLIVREVIPLEPPEIVIASPGMLRVRTEGFVRLMKRAERENATLGFLHGHPGGYDWFSVMDDENESNLWLALRKRFGDTHPLGSLLALPNGTWRGRVWAGSGHPISVPVRVNGAHNKLHDCAVLGETEQAHLSRQALLFGAVFNQQLASLRIVVVGAGGTGSPLCLMLARSGVRHLTVIDPDYIEDTNVHRNYIATMNNVGEAKAEQAKAEIDRLGLGVHCEPYIAHVSDEVCREALKKADVVICATDDHAGRVFLNRFAYCYETLVIDMGLAADIAEDGSIADITGRVTRLHPGAPCLICRKVINLRKAREEHLRRTDPDAYASQAAEGYVIDQGDPEPAFIAMTTSVATMAHEELVQCFSQYRGAQNAPAQRLRRFIQLEDRRSGGKPDSDCPVCGTGKLWSRGDMDPFLDQVN